MMPTQQQHSTSSSSSSSNDSDKDLLAPSPPKKQSLINITSRPFKVGRGGATNKNNNNNSRPIYGRRSKSYDPRLNSRVANEDRVPANVRIVPENLMTREVVHSSKKEVRQQRRRRRGVQSDAVAGMRSTSWLSTKDYDRGASLVYPTHDGSEKDEDDALEVCKESMSPDVADYQVKVVEHKKREGVSKSSKRRLSYPNDREEQNDQLQLLDEQGDRLPANKMTPERNKRRRMKRTVNDNENIPPQHHAHDRHDKEDNLSFTETSEQEELHESKKSNQRHRRRSSTGTKATTTIVIQTKSKKGGVVIPNTKSYIKELRDLAKSNRGTATQYKATYHTGVKPIIDKNSSSSRSSSSKMIQVGQLIIKETSVTSKGNKGGNSYLFENWKLPGSKQRDSSIYDSTRPRLIGVEGDASSVVLTTRAPYLIVDTALSTEDAARVRKFVMEGESGQTSMEFFARVDDDNSGKSEDDDERKEDLIGGSVVSEENDERGIDQGRRVLGDRSNIADRTQLRGRDKKSPDMKLSNKFHKGRTKSARKKRKSANISPTEPRKKRMIDSIVRFYVPDSKGDSQKCFGFIEGIGGGLEEKGLSNVTPHRGRLLELPGSVLSGQWESRLVKEKDCGNAKSIRISLRHESSPLRSIENVLTGKDDSPGGHFVSVIKPAINRTDSLICQGVVLEEEYELDNDGMEQISNDAFVGCVSLVLFDGFQSSSEAIAESSGVVNRFLNNCVPSNELQAGRQLYGIVGNEHNSNDDENITGMLFPCNVSLDSDHVVLLLHDEESRVSGVDIIFRPSKKWLSHHPLTEALLHDHLYHTRSGDGGDEIMKRYIEKNVPSPMRPKAASVVSEESTSDSDFDSSVPIPSEDSLKQRDCDLNGSDNESLGFEHTAQPDFDVNNDDLSSLKDAKDDEKVHRLEEESRSLKQRIERLEEEKRLLKQQIVDKPSVQLANPEEHVNESVAADDEIADDPVQIEPVATTLANPLEETAKVARSAEIVNDDSVAVNKVADVPVLTETLATSQSQKKVFVDLFGDNDSIIGELANRQSHVEPPAVDTKTFERKKALVKDLFDDGDSLFGVSKKKQIKRRKSTGGLINHRTSFQKQNRGRHSTGGLPNRRKSLGGTNSVARVNAQAKLIPSSRAPSQRTSKKKSFVSERQTAAEKGRRVSSNKNNSSTVVTQTSRKSTRSVRSQTKTSTRRSTFPSKLRLSTGGNTAVSKKSNATVSMKKVKVADLFEDDCFGCAAKALSESNGAKSIRPSLIPNDMHSVSSLGGGSLSFESMSTQTLAKVHTSANPTQPLFDIYFGKEKEDSSHGENNDAVQSLQQTGTQPFFDYYFGQDMSATNDDESTQYSIQPFHSVYYGRGSDDQSTLHSITSTFEISSVPPSLYYFDNDGVVTECVPTARPPFFDHYFGQLNDEDEESSTVSSSAGTFQQVPLADENPSFFDHYYGQEDIGVQERNVATKTSWRCLLVGCFQFLVVGVIPTALPLALLLSKQYNPDFSHQFDMHRSNEIVGETTSSWWSLKPWE